MHYKQEKAILSLFNMPSSLRELSTISHSYFLVNKLQVAIPIVRNTWKKNAWKNWKPGTMYKYLTSKRPFQNKTEAIILFLKNSPNSWNVYFSWTQTWLKEFNFLYFIVNSVEIFTANYYTSSSKAQWMNRRNNTWVCMSLLSPSNYYWKFTNKIKTID